MEESLRQFYFGTEKWYFSFKFTFLKLALGIIKTKLWKLSSNCVPCWNHFFRRKIKKNMVLETLKIKTKKYFVNKRKLKLNFSREMTEKSEND